MLQVLDGSKKHNVDGRAAAIVRRVLRQLELINGSAKVKVEFNCAGPTVKPVITIFDDEERIVWE